MPKSTPVGSETSQREREQPRVDASGRRRQRELLHQPHRPVRQDHSGDAAQQRQHRALGEVLPRHAPRPRPERQPDRELAAPRDRARQQQVRHVRARDDEHEGGDQRQP